MQLHFTTDELKLLVEVLQGEDNRRAEDLLDRILVRELAFSFDELEDLADIVSTYLEGVRVEAVRGATPQTRALQQVLAKITEACAVA